MGFNSGFKGLNKLNDPDRPQCVKRGSRQNLPLIHRSALQPKTYVKSKTAITIFWAYDDGRCFARNMLRN